MLEAEERENGYPCPRREWPDPIEGPMLWQLILLGAHQETAHVWRAVLDVHFEGAPVEDKERALQLMLRAFNDETIAAFLWPSKG